MPVKGAILTQGRQAYALHFNSTYEATWTSVHNAQLLLAVVNPGCLAICAF